jgi:hypothetical protein
MQETAGSRSGFSSLLWNRGWIIPYSSVDGRQGGVCEQQQGRQAGRASMDSIVGSSGSRGQRRNRRETEKQRERERERERESESSAPLVKAPEEERVVD